MFVGNSWQPAMKQRSFPKAKRSLARISWNPLSATGNACRRRSPSRRFKKKLRLASVRFADYEATTQTTSSNVTAAIATRFTLTSVMASTRPSPTNLLVRNSVKILTPRAKNQKHEFCGNKNGGGARSRGPSVAPKTPTPPQRGSRGVLRC